MKQLVPSDLSCNRHFAPGQLSAFGLCCSTVIEYLSGYIGVWIIHSLTGIGCKMERGR